MQDQKIPIFWIKKKTANAKKSKKYPYYAVDILLQTTRLMFRLKMF